MPFGVFEVRVLAPPRMATASDGQTVAHVNVAESVRVNAAPSGAPTLPADTGEQDEYELLVWDGDLAESVSAVQTDDQLIVAGESYVEILRRRHYGERRTRYIVATHIGRNLAPSRHRNAQGSG